MGKPPLIAAPLVLLLSLAVSGCAPGTKDWHRQSAAHIIPRVYWSPAIGTVTENAVPPRGPEVSFLRVLQIHVGDSGDRIYAVTRPSFPLYDRDFAFVTTSIVGRPYEVAFRYAPDKSGRISDISYLPVPKPTR